MEWKRGRGLCPGHAFGRLVEGFDPDCPVLDFVTVVLEHDVAAFALTEVRHGGEFAFADSLDPVFAADGELGNEVSVEPVFNVLAVDDEADIVPDASGSDEAGFGRIKAVDRTGGGQVVGSVGMAVVIEDLHFWPGFPGGAAVFGGAVHDAAVAAGGDAPLESEFEATVLLGGADVATFGAGGEGQIAAGSGPSAGNGISSPTTPAVETGAIEEEAESVSSFFGGELVGDGVATRGDALGPGGELVKGVPGLGAPEDAPAFAAEGGAEVDIDHVAFLHAVGFDEEGAAVTAEGEALDGELSFVEFRAAVLFGAFVAPA